MNKDDLELGATQRGIAAGQHMFNRYVLTRQLGRGGTCTVWLAHDEKLDTDVALKFLPEQLSIDAAAIADLKRETRRSLQLTHPNIVLIYDFVEDDRMAAVSMEYVDGVSLTQLRLERPEQVFEVDEIKPWIKQLCDALGYAHGKARIVHRDLKPANLMINKDGDLKVTDFGLSATICDSTTRASYNDNSSSQVYMSPQLMMGDRPAASDDIYSLGATIYELLTGKPPFYSGNIPIQVQKTIPLSMTEMRKNLGVEAAAPIPEVWEKTVAACLSKGINNRPRSAKDVISMLNGMDLAAVCAAGGSSLPCSAKRTAVAQNPVASSKTAIIRILSISLLLTAVITGVFIGVRLKNEKRKALEARVQMQAIEAENSNKLIEAAQKKNEAAALAKAEADKAKEETARQLLNAKNAASEHGSIAITTEPAGALIRIGTETLGNAPLTAKELKVGKCNVNAQLPDYDDWTGEAEITRDTVTTLSVTMRRQKGSLSLDSTPLKANWVIVDKPQDSDLETDRGITPMVVDNLPTGHYSVKYSIDGWADVFMSADITNGSTETIIGKFPSGKIVINSDPNGSTIMDSKGNVIGVTPHVISNTKVGKYQFSISRDGYKNSEVFGDLNNDGVLNLLCKLDKAPELSEAAVTKIDEEAATTSIQKLPQNAKTMGIITIRTKLSGKSVSAIILSILEINRWNILDTGNNTISAEHYLSRTWAGVVFKLGNVSNAKFYITFDNHTITIYDITNDSANARINKKLARILQNNLERAFRNR